MDLATIIHIVIEFILVCWILAIMAVVALIAYAADEKCKGRKYAEEIDGFRRDFD